MDWINFLILTSLKYLEWELDLHVLLLARMIHVSYENYSRHLHRLIFKLKIAIFINTDKGININFKNNVCSVLSVYLELYDLKQLPKSIKNEAWSACTVILFAWMIYVTYEKYFA